MQKYIRQSRVSSCIDIFYRGISSLQLWISLGPIETGDLGRHKRVVVIDEFGRKEVFIEKTKAFSLMYPKPLEMD